MKEFLLSIVTPFYNEEKAISNYFENIIPILEQTHKNYEIVCIDDGSKDNTYAILKKYHEKNSKIKVVKFSRNFGKEAALTAAFDLTNGDCVIPIDADLQDPPNMIDKMLKAWKDGNKVVLMKRKERGDSKAKIITAKLFYKLIKFMSNTNIPQNVGDFRLLDKQVINVVRSLREQSRFTRGLLSWSGFKTTTIEYDRPKRVVGEASYSMIQSIKQAFDGIFSFSTFPIRIWIWIGSSISFLSFIFAIWIILSKLYFNIGIEGWSSLMVLILFMGGIQLLSIGIIGEYTGRVYSEVKNRPLYVIEEKLF